MCGYINGHGIMYVLTKWLLNFSKIIAICRVVSAFCNHHFEILYYVAQEYELSKLCCLTLYVYSYLTTLLATTAITNLPLSRSFNVDWLKADLYICMHLAYTASLDFL